MLKELIGKFINQTGREDMDVPTTTPPVTPEVPPAAPQAPLAPKAPANMADTLEALPANIKDFVERAVADKQNALAQAKKMQEESDAAKKVLGELVAEKEAAEKKSLEEQGNFKALYEQSELKRSQLEQAVQERILKETVAKELAKQGGLSDYLAEAVLIHHKDSILYKDGQVLGAAEAVAALKLAQPQLFKPEAVAPGAPNPSLTGTGVPINPPTALNPSAFNAVGATMKDVDANFNQFLAQIRERK
jgi:hypothetical protein